MERTESSLKALTVPKLKVNYPLPLLPLSLLLRKTRLIIEILFTDVAIGNSQEILAAEGLSQAGKKDELITRILELPSSSIVIESTTESIPVPSDPILPLPSSLPLPEVPLIPSVVVPEVAPTVAVVVEPVVIEKTAEEKLILAKAEEDKRAARAARFGDTTTTTETTSAADKRAERFGTGTSGEEAVNKVPFYSFHSVEGTPLMIFVNDDDDDIDTCATRSTAWY
jgi:hypothetical protein